MIDKTREYTTRDGRDVRIYATDCGGKYTVHGAYLGGPDAWIIDTWTEEGKHGGNSDLDLIEKPKVIKGWINIYRSKTSASDMAVSIIRDTKEEADNASRDDRVACIQVEFKEGEGL